jgi:osmotically-inducible protein OsmY
LIIKERVMIYGLVADPAAETLREAVLDEIDREPALHAWEIGVAAEDGVVTLSGTVDSQAERMAAERAVKRVEGVRTVANDLRVRTQNERTDTDIARDAAHRLRNNIAVPETVQAVVSDGYITLEGTVRWMHQRAAAETAVKYLRGVKKVENGIRVLEF